MIAEFQRLAPYLKDPLVLIGFFLLIASSFSRYLVKRGVIVPLSKTQGYRIIRLILLFGFIIGLLIVVLGFTLKRQELERRRRTAESIELMLRDTLSNFYWLSEEKKNEIVKQILDGYRTGALSKEQIEQRVEEIKVSSIKKSNYSSELSSSQNQASKSNTIEPAVNSPPVTSPVKVDNSSLEAAQPIKGTTGTEKQSAPGTTTRTYTPPNEVYMPPNEVRRIVVGLACAIDITAPKPESKVRRDALVSGRARIPADTYLWILGHKKGLKGWWPQGGGEVQVKKDGDWEVLVVFGKPREIGTFEIAAVVVDKQTNEDLKRWVEDAPRKGYPPINFPNPLEGCSVKTVSVDKVGD